MNKKMIKNSKKAGSNFLKRIVIFFCCLTFILSGNYVWAVTSGSVNEYSGAGAEPLIGVEDIGTQKGIIGQWMDQLEAVTDTKAWEQFKLALSKATAVGYKKALEYFLNELAFNTATYLATGDKGQTPMFETDNIGDFLEKTADNAAGVFIENLGKNGYLNFNLCQPSTPFVDLKIKLGLIKYSKPSKPECTFSEMTKNWEEALDSPKFLTDFQDMFNPWSNDLGITLSLFSGITTEVESEVKKKGLGYEINEGIHAVIDPISGKVKTPGAAVEEQMLQSIKEGTASYKVYTGDAVADAIGVFVNTLAGKLMEKWFKEGLVTNFPDTGYDWSKLQSETAAGGGGTAAAQNRFAAFTNPNFSVRGDYDILIELTLCPDPTKAGPTNCVITNSFRQAIENRLTVGQAMDQGYLNRNGIFGFSADGLEPNYFDSHYPYRSMVILRKFRILPVGWELAAEYIKNNPQVIGSTRNLGDLVACFDSSDDYTGYFADWCAGLVDPSWVLKAPLNYCKREGPGPEIISEMIVGQGDDSQRAISRDSGYCADEQACVKELSDGSCQLYGYCTQERRTWNFNADICEPKYNTCQTFRARDGSTVSYLENSLDYCGSDEAGCQAYCADYDYESQDYTCAIDSGEKIHFNKNVDSCDSADEGCHEFVRIKPEANQTLAEIQAGGVEAAYSANYPQGTTYLKLLPDYLEGSCYELNTDGFQQLRSDAPAECQDYVRKCNTNELGCELYTSAKDNMSIPAKVEPEDYCDAECVGYDSYVQGETAFESRKNAYFIPASAKTCGAEAAGCDEFTNLDKAEEGGEARENYIYLRQCVKPGSPGANCANFYTWEGSDEAGYQLKSFTLKREISGSGPFDISGGESYQDRQCASAADYDLVNNPMCREFYNDLGQVFYRFYNFTVTCSDNCHPYRLTGLNIDPLIAVQADCQGADRHWFSGPGENYCVVCKSGGAWSDEQGACIYTAVPGEGKACSAANVGCREYSGSEGGNMSNIFITDFDSGSAQNWTGEGTNIEVSNESLAVGGGSLWVKDGNYSVSYQLGNLIHRGSLYTLSFLAKASTGSRLSAVYLANGDDERAQFSTTNLSNEWVYYKINLSQEVEHIVSSDEKLVIEADGGFYIDNIRLTEILDRYYLIKDSWATPAACNQDPDGNPHPLYDLGCERYADRSGTTHYLRSFSQLCADSAVGCELMIDTHNYSGQDALTVKSVTAPADSFAYVVYDQDKRCLSEDKGCERLGDPYQYGDEVIYGDIYLKNNPDRYDEILCLPGEVGCEEWTSSEGVYYFRDPGDMACQWRQEFQGGFGWFKKKIKRCDTNSDGYGDGGICLNDSYCLSGQICLEEGGDTACPTSPWLTFGYGGSAGQVVNQPTSDSSGYWAGLCPAEQSGCSEYIDPVSAFNANTIFNADFSQDVDNNGPDGWSGNSQEIALKSYTLYRLAGEGNAASISLDCPDALYILNQNNVLTTAPFVSGENVYRADVDIDPGPAGLLVYSAVNSTGCEVSVGNSNGKIELKKAVVSYQIKSGLDKASCNGLVDLEKGCVLFNERIQNGSNLAGLKWDADLTINDQTGVSPQTGVLSDRDANALIKVSPDRVCQEWLACRSFIKDENGNNVCFDIGLCDSFDDNGNCNNFVISEEQNQLYSVAEIGKYSNATGYSKVGYNSGGSLKNDYYPFGAMEQEGEVAKVPNGNFEFSGSNGYPVGWTYEGGGWNENVFKVVNNPIGAQAEGVGQAPEGRGFLKLGSIYSATSEFIDVIDDIEYIITANVNTINLSEGSAEVEIDQYNSIGNLIAQSSNLEVMSLAAGSDWNFEVGKFITNPNATRIKVTLHSQAGTTGNFYFDDVKIRPALISRSQDANNWYTVQDCRLYPEDDALSCDYFEDSGDRQKGWPGYCLEYDRYPGSPDACLLWYPIDKVKGDGIEEGAGYNGKIPVYYCLEASGLQALEYRQARYIFSVTSEWWDNWCQDAACNATSANYTSSGMVLGAGDCYCAPVGGGCVTECSGPFGTDGWYPYDGSFEESEANYGVKYYNPNTHEFFDDIFAYCTKVVQTVDSVGGNKYWSGRVYEGSNYTTPVLGLGYNASDPPFGSIVEPYPINNPYEWDGSSADGNQPIYINNEGGASANSPYKMVNTTIGMVGKCSNSGRFCLTVGGVGYDVNKADCAPGEGTCASISFPANPSESIRRLFTQSYGHWTWSNGENRYIKIDGQDWGPPVSLCSGGVRPAYPNDYCAISPAVNNIKINSQTDDVALNKNGFVNLTFNSKVDSQQQPLVMYAVDWGDDEKMVVTGVEMRDRPNEANPHSLYHLYSYWDLKAKDASGVADVNCDATCSISPDINDSCCWIKPKVKIKDNWGWCNGGQEVHDCDYWQDYGGWVVVTEK